MRVIQAAKAGFCFGVKRALEFADKTVETQPTATFGPLIHNQQVVDRLQAKGIEAVDAIDSVNNKTLIIRSHGVPPEVYQAAEDKGVKVIDATCPFVQKAQRLAAEAAKGNQVIVVGDKHHPEVQGILGWAGHDAIAAETVEEAERLPHFAAITVLAQTTQPLTNFEAIVAELKKHSNSLTIHNTICNATEERQRAAGELAAQVDVMIVAGGLHSANTKKLAAICAEKTKTYHIETAAELKNIWFENCHLAGLTAGASTPDWIIEEVYKKMSEINEQDIKQEAVASNQETQEMETENGIETMESWDEDFQKLHRGAIVKGTVVKITDEDVFVDIGWKSEGIITLNELSVTRLKSPKEAVSIGDKISALVLRVENEEGYTVLSRRRVAETEAVDRLAQMAETKVELQAKAMEVVKGGLLVDVGMRGFVPASQVQLGYVEDLNQFIGQTLRLRIIDFDPSKKKVVLSQKVILAEEQATNREQLLATLQEGESVTGEVRRLTNFGAFVDLGGADGLLHISDMAYSRIKHPSEVVQVGDRVEVQVLSIDREKGKISLGLKQLKLSPWAGAADKYPVGSIVNGKVVRIAPFGAFVQLEDGVDALVHISQLAQRRIAKVEEVVKVGDMISAKVIECKPEEKRISLSIREAAADAEAALNQEALQEQTEAPPVTIGEVLGEKPEA